MRICFVGTDIGPNKDGVFVRGHVNNIIRLSKELHKMGHSVHIITNIPKFSTPSLYDKWIDFARVSHFSTNFPSLKINGPEFALKALDRVKQDNKQYDFDIINFHSGFPALALLSVTCKKVTRKTIVHTLYSPFDYSISNVYFDRHFISKLTDYSFSRLDHVVAINANVQKSLLNTSGQRKKKITVIPPIISDEFLYPQGFEKETRLHLNIPDEAPVITYIGGFEESKGLPILLRIISLVIKKNPNVVFVIALNTPSYDARIGALNKHLEKCGIAKNTRVLGITSQIAKVIQLGDFFVAPYLHTMGVADYPLAVFEAMGLGKIVIGFDIGGISSLLQDGRGILIAPYDVPRFAEMVLKLLNRQLSDNTISKKANAFVLQNFSAKNVAGLTIDLFNDLLRKN